MHPAPTLTRMVMTASLVVVVVVVVVVFVFGVMITAGIGAGAELRLDRRMGDAMPRRQPLLDRSDDGVRVRPLRQAGMKGRHVLLAVHRPDMHVVYLAHVGIRGNQVRGDHIAVDARWRAFEKQRLAKRQRD